jgi:hypothetical protein
MHQEVIYNVVEYMNKYDTTGDEKDLEEAEANTY